MARYCSVSSATGRHHVTSPAPASDPMTTALTLAGMSPPFRVTAWRPVYDVSAPNVKERSVGFLPHSQGVVLPLLSAEQGEKQLAGRVHLSSYA